MPHPQLRARVEGRDVQQVWQCRPVHIFGRPHSDGPRRRHPSDSRSPSDNEVVIALAGVDKEDA
jgi:hypothetical protein